MSKIFLLEALTEIVETVIYTSCLPGETPVSIILVGPSGTAKSLILKSYASDAIHVTDSITSAGLWSIAQNDHKNERKFILIPDINPTLSRRSSTKDATVGNLLSLTGDGTVRIDDGRGDKICKHSPMGLLTACTPEIYHRNAKQWFALGLRRRIIPVFYRYTKETEDKLQDRVRNGDIHTKQEEPKKLILKDYGKPGITPEQASLLQVKGSQLAVNLGKLKDFNPIKGTLKWELREVVPISPHITMRLLAMAHAIRRNSARIEQQELEFLARFISFTDPEFPRQI